MGLISQKRLEEFCHEGRFKKSPTVIGATSLFHEATSSVLIIMVEPHSGNDLGYCAINDIRSALESFAKAIAAENDSHIIRNPNLIKLLKAFERAEQFDGEARGIKKQDAKHELRKRFSVVDREPA